MSENFVCWKCGKSIEYLPLPLSRQAECADCGADLHCCKLCVFYNVNVSNQCSEPIAEFVQEKSRANFCGYFQVKPNAFNDRDNKAADDAKKQLESLFGVENKHDSGSENPDQGREELEKLFGVDKNKDKDK